MTGEESLRETLRDLKEEGEVKAQSSSNGLDYSRARATELAASMRGFLRMMKAAGNPGLQRPASERFTGRRSWDYWIYPDGSASDYGPKHRKPLEQYAIELLTQSGYDGPRPDQGDTWRMSVDARVRETTRHLAEILARNGMP